jgi:hypothetical protein
MAVGLPAAYDPTIKPVDPMSLLRRPVHQPVKNARGKAVGSVEKKAGEDSESEDEEDEFEVTAGAELLRKEKLLKMESNEGAALRVLSKDSASFDSDEDPGGGGDKT